MEMTGGDTAFSYVEYVWSMATRKQGLPRQNLPKNVTNQSGNPTSADWPVALFSPGAARRLESLVLADNPGR